ncbi:uncharacterized protein LOC127253041 isoform X2 [Andrographis paniculata]|uniref:uncharacterized protein LOC127253041 isoform X2 n=1 Tax=Andrographis paniculata TaxID=175694 RepID=UPI0021E92736|nr:uncharacterized protein LOC127253041 isoform X2 [Andrographis paniculata]
MMMEGSNSKEKEGEEYVLHTEPSFAIYNSSEEKIEFGAEEEEEDRTKLLDRSAAAAEAGEFSFGRQQEQVIQSSPYHHINSVTTAASIPNPNPNPQNHLQGQRGAAEDDHDDNGAAAKASSSDDYFYPQAQDSHSLAAYASYLWSLEEEEDDDDDDGDQQHQHQESLANASKVNNGNGNGSPETLPLETNLKQEFKKSYSSPKSNDKEDDQYRRMVEEDPCNPLFLRNYANYLNQVKGDIRGSEEYYARAIVADPSDGQTRAIYANMLWQHHGNKDRATAHFEQAIQAAPQDSVRKISLGS